MDLVTSLGTWQGNTLIDPIVYLCMMQVEPVVIPRSNRLTLARLFGQMGYRAGAEIGVGSGPYSEAICLANPGVHLYCVDAWDAYPGYRDFTDPNHLIQDYKMAQIRLAPYNVTLMRKKSLDAAECFDSDSLDFVYIDANHDAPFIGDDIAAWSPKVRSGGIVSGHDYASIHPDVIEAVDNYTAGQHIHPFYLVGEPLEHSNVDSICSWFWVQP